MASQTDLVAGTAKSFPINYLVDFNCSEETLQKKIDEVASFVANVYAKFAKMDIEERNQLRKEGVWLTERAQLPSPLESEQFEVELKKRIIRELTQETTETCSVHLSTDYRAQGLLREVINSVFLEKEETFRIFPQKTSTTITLKNKNTLLCLRMRFINCLF